MIHNHFFFTIYLTWNYSGFENNYLLKMSLKLLSSVEDKLLSSERINITPSNRSTVVDCQKKQNTAYTAFAYTMKVNWNRKLIN